MDSVFIFLATHALAVPVVVIAVQFFFIPRENKARFVVIALVSCVVALLAAKAANHFLINPRPFVVENFAPLIPHAPDNGFPSDHALLAGTLAALSTLLSWRYGAVMWLLALAIGVGRVEVGVHHPIDVLGAFAIGILAVILIKKIAAKSKY